MGALSLLCFPGYTGRFAGLDAQLFEEKVRSFGLFDEVETLAPDYRKWAQKGFQDREFYSHLRYAKGVQDSARALVAIGFSVGGFAALRIGAAAGARGVLALKPPVDLSDLRAGKGSLADFVRIDPVLAELRTALIVYDESDRRKAHDPAQAKAFERFPQIDVTSLDAFDINEVMASGRLRAWLSAVIGPEGRF